MSLSVVMPVYNEEEIIETVVKSINQTILSKIQDSEFIIVNDCSTDKTGKILYKLQKNNKKIKVLKTPVNSGHGKALKLGYLNAKKNWVFHIDSDNEYDINDFWKLYELKNKYDIILGYRKNRNDPLHRLILTRVARLTNFLLFGFLIKDSNSAFRILNNRALKHIINNFPDSNYSVYSMLISLMGKKLNYRIIEVPVTHFGRKSGKCHYVGWKLAKGVYKGFMDVVNLRIKSMKIPKSEYLKAEQIKKDIYFPKLILKLNSESKKGL